MTYRMPSLDSFWLARAESDTWAVGSGDVELFRTADEAFARGVVERLNRHDGLAATDATVRGVAKAAGKENTERGKVGGWDCAAWLGYEVEALKTECKRLRVERIGLMEALSNLLHFVPERSQSGIDRTDDVYKDGRDVLTKARGEPATISSKPPCSCGVPDAEWRSYGTGRRHYACSACHTKMQDSWSKKP